MVMFSDNLRSEEDPGVGHAAPSPGLCDARAFGAL